MQRPNPYTSAANVYGGPKSDKMPKMKAKAKKKGKGKGKKGDGFHGVKFC